MNEYIEINDTTKFVDLNQFGFLEAGKVGGNPDLYNKYLNNIYSGGIIDKDIFKPLSDLEKQNIRREIDSLKINIKENESKIEDIEIKSKDFKKLIETKNKEMISYLDGTIGAAGLQGKKGIDIFSWPKFLIASFFGLMLSVFVFLFYVAVTYKGLVMTDGDMANLFKEGNFGLNVLPHWNEVSLALRTNPMIAVAPFVFFAFGYAIHIFLEKDGYAKVIGIVMIGSITFCLDYFLALRIHDKMNNALSIMDLPPNDAFEDILIVLILGFVVYVIWSVIFHFWYKELEKRNIPNQIGKVIKFAEQKIEELQNKKSALVREVKVLNEKITSEEAKMNKRVVSIAVIVRSISEFTTGWLRFLKGSNNQQDLEFCSATHDDFIRKKNLGAYDR